MDTEQAEILSRLRKLEMWLGQFDKSDHYAFHKNIRMPNLRKFVGGVYGGKVADDGSAVDLPAGWSSAKSATGIYAITHNLGTTSYVVTTNVDISGDMDTSYTANFKDATTTSFKLNIVKQNAYQDTNKYFSFIVLII